MTKKDNSAVDEYMARPDLPESLKAANRDYLGAEDWVCELEERDAAKAKPLADQLQYWQAFAQAPWEPPAGLGEGLSKLERDYPATLSLSQAVDLMAFGGEPVPDLMADGEKLEAGARRRQAFEALRNAARQERFPLEHGADSESIKPGRFKSIQGMGGEIDSLEFNDSKEGKPDKHLEKVQIVDAAKFYVWLRGHFEKPNDTAREANKIRKGGPGRKQLLDWDAEVRPFMLKLLQERGDYDEPGQMSNWNCQARMEGEVANYVAKLLGRNDHKGLESVVRSWIAKFMPGLRQEIRGTK